MARISTYNVDATPELGDIVIGTDTAPGNNLRTKNYSWGQIANMLAATNSSGVADQVTYTFQADISNGRNIGSLSLPAGGETPFSRLTTCTISKTLNGAKSVSEYIPLFLNKEIILARLGDLNNYGVYKVTSIQDNPLDATFWDITLEVKSSNGQLFDLGVYIFSEFQYTTSSDKTYVHRQDTPSSVWTVNHNLNKFPSATLTLSTNQTGYGDVQYINQNTLTITLANPESGKAYIN